MHRYLSRSACRCRAGGTQARMAFIVRPVDLAKCCLQRHRRFGFRERDLADTVLNRCKGLTGKAVIPRSTRRNVIVTVREFTLHAVANKFQRLPCAGDGERIQQWSTPHSPVGCNSGGAAGVNLGVILGCVFMTDSLAFFITVIISYVHAEIKPFPVIFSFFHTD